MLLKYTDDGNLYVDKIYSAYTCADLAEGYLGDDSGVPGVIFKCVDEDTYVYVITSSFQEAEYLVDDIFTRGKLSVKHLPTILVFEDDPTIEIAEKLDMVVKTKKNVSKDLHCFQEDML